jgi:hypothetical protein
VTAPPVERARETKRKLVEHLIEAKRAGNVVWLRRPRQGKHAPQLLRHPHRLHRLHRGSHPYKQATFPPGTDIPIRSPEKIAEVEPDVILILPWNFKDEIIEQLAYARSWGAEFVVPIPEVTIY